MSRFSTQELFLTGMTVVVVGFTVAVGSSSLTSLVGMPDDRKYSEQSQDGEGSLGDTGGSSEQKSSVVPEKTDGNDRPVISPEERMRWEELQRRAQEGERRTAEDFWKQVREEDKRMENDVDELSREEIMNKDGTVENNDVERFEEAMKKQQEYIEAMKKQMMHGAPQEMPKSDIMRDGTMDQSDVEKLQEVMRQNRDINQDGMVNQMDMEKYQEMMKVMQDRVMEERGMKMAPRDIDGDGVMTPEDYGYMREVMEEMQDALEEEEAQEPSIWENLKKTFYQGDKGEEKVDYTVEYAPDGSVESTTTYEYFDDEHPSAENAAPEQESLWSKLNPLHWFKSQGTTPQGRPFNGKPVPGRPFNEEDFSEGRPFQEGDAGEEQTEFGGATTGGAGDTGEPGPDIIQPTPSYEDFLQDRSGANGDGVNWNGINGMNGINGVNGVNGMNGINGMNGLNGIDAINGVNGINGMNVVNGVHGAPDRGFWDTVKGLFGF